MFYQDKRVQVNILACVIDPHYRTKCFEFESGVKQKRLPRKEAARVMNYERH